MARPDNGETIARPQLPRRGRLAMLVMQEGLP